ncbi:hypothetical protein [Arthrobacter psychrolactophilus]
MTAGNDRAQGWRDALRDANLADDLIAQGNFTKSTAYQAMNDLLRQPHH